MLSTQSENVASKFEDWFSACPCCARMLIAPTVTIIKVASPTDSVALMNVRFFLISFLLSYIGEQNFICCSSGLMRAPRDTAHNSPVFMGVDAPDAATINLLLLHSEPAF